MPLLQPSVLMLVALAVTPVIAQTTSYYVEPGSYSTQRDSEPPAYVRNLGEPGRSGPAWLDAGLDYRLRTEHRDDDIRRFQSEGLDVPLLLRTRAYLGVRNLKDPLRLVLEFEDDRRHRSKFVKDDRDVNELEFIQVHAELYFPATFGKECLLVYLAEYPVTTAEKAVQCHQRQRHQLADHH